MVKVVNGGHSSMSFFISVVKKMHSFLNWENSVDSKQSMTKMDKPSTINHKTILFTLLLSKRNTCLNMFFFILLHTLNLLYHTITYYHLNQ